MLKERCRYRDYQRVSEMFGSNPNVSNFLSKNPIPGRAIDFGCGSGRDTKMLLDAGWEVLAIDGGNVANYYENIPPGQKEKLTIQDQQLFEHFVARDQFDLAIINNSSWYCLKDCFDEFWLEVIDSLKPDGYLLGNFLGNYDAWVQSGSKVGFSISELEKFFGRNFQNISFEEKKYDGFTQASQKPKFWHLIWVEAQKI